MHSSTLTNGISSHISQTRLDNKRKCHDETKEIRIGRSLSSLSLPKVVLCICLNCVCVWFAFASGNQNLIQREQKNNDRFTLFFFLLFLPQGV